MRATCSEHVCVAVKLEAAGAGWQVVVWVLGTVLSGSLHIHVLYHGHLGCPQQQG